MKIVEMVRVNTIARRYSSIIPNELIIETPAGIKNRDIYFKKKSEVCLTASSLSSLRLSDKKSKSIPIIEPGKLKGRR